MIGNMYGMKSRFILLDKDGKVVYGSQGNKDEINAFLEESHVYDRIKTGDFGIKKWGDSQVTMERIFVNNQSLYVIELIADVQAGRFSSMAYKDMMSGLYNRNMWEYMMHNKFTEVQGCFDTLMIIDIDNLKEVNDSEGHAVGDIQIRIVSESIKESIREEDIAFRYGGDEFVILLNGLKNKDIQKLMDRIREKINEKSKDHGIHVSMGVSSFDNFSGLMGAFQKADNLLYAEKQCKKLQVGSKKYKELLKLRKNMDEIRNHLNDLMGENKDHLNEDVLGLSRELDHVIYRYSMMEIGLKSKELLKKQGNSNIKYK
ncbi:diguanylate cyclase (GGDEF)-like protein [Anaerosolibacter carboniphilus]|uniref:Diguanylate cyclase (GGDEF)-like protein n=1 Tax=Anaerosolibacter carboniphilus TaxID=1417629 RepID=A0A841KW96_9FIRM|nr:GGDEF domain-containing protein [Anaerosolibacter carboniphilus]MBB6215192.1 diguanylate cyclase (GGDEF)-like protein [Anaerosolibacter carboniphilus]